MYETCPSVPCAMLRSWLAGVLSHPDGRSTSTAQARLRTASGHLLDGQRVSPADLTRTLSWQTATGAAIASSAINSSSGPVPGKQFAAPNGTPNHPIGRLAWIQLPPSEEH